MKYIDFDVRIDDRHFMPMHEIVYNVYDFPLSRDHPIRQKGKDSNVAYRNIPCVFDIETTSMHGKELKESYGFMYHWQMCIVDKVVFGRTWNEFLFLLKRIVKEMNTKEFPLVIYAHNLGFEWQFMNQFLKSLDRDIKCFYVKKRQPLVIRLKNVGLEFRCSWKLSNMGAEKFIKNSGSLYLKQVEVNYDYGKVRTPITPLTPEEEAYCYCDVRGVADAIAKELDHGYTIASIPLTSTGYVRRDTLRAYQYYDNYLNGKYCPEKWKKIFSALPYHEQKKAYKDYYYRDRFKKEAIDATIYELEKDCARGGDTKANVIHSGKIRNNVFSFDRVSSYPAVQLTYKYPAGKWTPYFPFDEKTLRKYFYDNNKATMARVWLEDVKLKETAAAPYIPAHKCSSMKKKYILDNGKVLRAKALSIAITDVDFIIMDELYDFKIVAWDDVYRTKKDYLPIPLRAVNMLYFIDKCELKHGDQYLYMKSKNKLNGIFGMTFTDIVHEEWLFDLNSLQWDVNKPDKQKAIDKYYNQKSSCLRYDSGIYTAAYARLELHYAIQAVGRKAFLYADTDSVKWYSEDVNERERILKWFKNRNMELVEKARVCGAYHTLNGEEFILGVWENESKDGGALYDRFITYGAKKYAYEYTPSNTDPKKGAFGITVAGLGKESGRKFYQNCDNFVLDSVVPEDQSGRTISVWRDEPIHHITVDGVDIVTASSCAVFDTTYQLGISKDYGNLMASSEIFVK